MMEKNLDDLDKSRAKAGFNPWELTRGTAILIYYIFFGVNKKESTGLHIFLLWHLVVVEYRG